MADMSALTPLSLKTQVLRFVATGGFAAVVDYGLYQFLLAMGLRTAVMAGVPGVIIAKTLSFIAGTATAYAINRRWTFQAPSSRSRLVSVALLYALTYAVQVGLNYICYLKFEGHSWRDPVAFVIAQGTATVINFVVQRVWIFRIH